MLLGQGGRANIADAQGRTPLMWAAMRANIPLCRLLLLYGANLNQRDNLGYTALALSLDEAGLYWMHSDSPPASISQADYVATAKWLVLHGASLQLKDTSWDNLLDLTSRRLRHWIPMCTFFLQQGATIHGGKSGGSVIMEEAASANAAQLLALALQRHPTQQEKNEALKCALGSRDCIRLLLEAGADANLPLSGIYSDQSLLEMAVLGKDPEVARLLIQYGANVNYKDGARMTPLKRAKGRNNIDMERMLQQAGANE